MAATAPISRGGIAIKRYASGLDTEKAHVLMDTVYKIRIRAHTKGVHVSLKASDTTNFYHIPLGTSEEFDVDSFGTRTIYLLEDAATAVCEIIEWHRSITAVG
jgi:hypothetical protein